MALSDYLAARAKVADIQQRLNSAIGDIRENESFSEQGRRQEMAKLALQAKRDAEALKERFVSERNARRESLETGLFGSLLEPSPAELMVLRDSRDRAQAIKSQEDAQLSLQLARQSGDKFMVKAIAQLALTKGWTSVVDAYAADNSHARSMLEQLAAIPSGPRTNTADAAAFSVQVPKELSAFTGVNAGHLERVAAGETQHLITNSDNEMEWRTI